MQTYKQISEEYKIPIRVLRRSSAALKLKGVYVGKEKVFDEEEVDKLIRYRNTVTPKYKLHHPRKIRIMQCYFKYGSGRKVAELLNLNRDCVNRVIKEFNQTGEIIVASKLNYE